MMVHDARVGCDLLWIAATSIFLAANERHSDIWSIIAKANIKNTQF
jgi:hypothetical protein